MNAIILVDFGMTASAAQCLIIPPSDIEPTKTHKFDKTPTQLLYGKTGEVVAWGNGLKTYDGVKEHFKIHFGTTGPSARHQDARDRSDLISIKEHENWTSDYLYHFCGNILNNVLCKENTTMEQLHVTWYITFPGSWNNSAQRDFKTVTRGALMKLSPGSEVIIDLTESLASCEFLVDHLRLPGGTWVITCDVGGATCDTAFAETWSFVTSRMPEAFPIASHGSVEGGVITIDKAFNQKIRPLVKQVEGINHVDLAKELTRSVEWQYARHNFDASTDVTFETKHELGKLKLASRGVSFDDRKITISSQEMEMIFSKFINNMFVEIDEAIRQVVDINPQRKPPTVIALCGGGGTMAYLLKRLKLRYSPDLDIRSPSSAEESRLATIIGHRIYRERHMLQDYLDQIVLGVSDPSRKHHAIIWHEMKSLWYKSPSRIASFEFCSRKRKATHYFIAYRRCCSMPRPESGDDLKRTPERWDGILIRTLNIAQLSKDLFRERKYCIEITCTGRDLFNFRAYDTKDAATKIQISYS